MRILIYSDTPEMGGAGQINHLIACGLKQRGMDLCVAQAQADHALIRDQVEIGIPHYWLRADDIYNNPLHARAFTDFHEPAAVFTAAAPDLVLFADGAPVSNLAARQTAAEQSIPFISLAHQASRQSLEQFSAHLPTLPALYRAARQVVTVSHNSLALLHSHYGLPPDKGLVIFNARPHVFFAPPNAAVRQAIRAELGIPPDALICLTSARVELSKGCHYLLEAARLLRASQHWPRLYFLWAGIGTRLEQMHALARLLQVAEHVRFLGQRNDIADLLDVADIFLLPSQSEGMPLAVIEAMAKSLPVMATAVGGTPEALGDCGALLPDPTEDKAAMLLELAATMERWADDAGLRQALGRGAHERAAKLFREDRMIDDYLALVRSVAAQSSPP